MADRVESFTVSCPANTLQSAAVEVPTVFTSGVVVRIEGLIPNGHAYLTGLAFAVAHSIIIPRTGSSWLIGDGDPIDYATDNYPDSGDWSVFLYNTDTVYNHGWQLRFHINDTLPQQAPPSTQPVPVSDILAAAAKT